MLKSMERPAGIMEKAVLAHLPTPLEPMTRLSDALDGPELWVKRDDCTGLGGGGNKTRKLERLIASALGAGADTVITGGGLQSNHARQTAAAAARVGLKCLLVLIDSVPGRSGAYYRNGNMLLNRIFGAEVRVVAAGTDIVQVMNGIADELSAAGGKPYIIPIGGSNADGARAYADAIDELRDQARGLGIGFDRIVVATGSAGTHAGLVAGSLAHGAGASIFGVSVARKTPDLHPRVLQLTGEVLLAMGSDRQVRPEDIMLDDGFIGDGYGRPTPEMVEAVQIVGRFEGLVLDPVYTGKAMAGLIHHVRSGAFGRDEKILFWHTGGGQGIFGYDETF